MYKVKAELVERLEDGPVLAKECKKEVANAVAHILDSVGEDPDRDGLSRTPERVARMYDEILIGYKVDPRSLLNNALFDVEYEQMVLVTDIEFYSMCEHHLVPFFGRCHVGYIPDGRIIGLSKVARIVEVFSRRLQVQERMTDQIADTMMTYVCPKGVAVVVEARHLCMMMRGVEKHNAVASTSGMRGDFRSSAALQTEFFGQIGPRSPGA